MAKKKQANTPKRKIGERTETIEVKLTQIQIEDERSKVCDLIQEKDELEEELKASKADYKAKIAEVDSKRAAALGAIRSGRVKREMIVEEWVTDQNEVVRVDKVTGEEIGRRNATARELQEELPLEQPNGNGDSKAEPDGDEEESEEVAHDPELAAEIAEDRRGEGDEFGEQA